MHTITLKIDGDPVAFSAMGSDMYATGAHVYRASDNAYVGIVMVSMASERYFGYSATGGYHGDFKTFNTVVRRMYRDFIAAESQPTMNTCETCGRETNQPTLCIGCQIDESNARVESSEPTLANTRCIGCGSDSDYFERGYCRDCVRFEASKSEPDYSALWPEFIPDHLLCAVDGCDNTARGNDETYCGTSSDYCDMHVAIFAMDRLSLATLANILHDEYGLVTEPVCEGCDNAISHCYCCEHCTRDNGGVKTPCRVPLSLN